MIPIDSIFSPVRRVAYEVEAARVGQRTDYDKLVLGDTSTARSTRATRSPQAANPHPPARRFTDLDAIEGFSEAAAGRRRAPVTHGMENFPIEGSSSASARSFLKRVGIETIGDLTSKSVELVAIPNFGRKSIEEVQASLGAHGLTLKGEELV